MPSLHNLILGGKELALVGSSVWFSLYGIRRKYKLDRNLDAATQLVRWSLVLSLFAFLEVTWEHGGTRNALLGIAYMAFVGWPNLAYYLTVPFRRRSQPEEPQHELCD